MRTIISLFTASLLAAGCGDDTTSPPDDEDIVEALAGIDGVLAVEEQPTSGEGYRFLVIEFAQPVDHQDPMSPTFPQLITLMHRSYDAPMVLASTGYFNYLGDNLSEPTRLLGANQIAVEHRYFAGSRPDPADWSQLTVAQAAADHHRIVAALAGLYQGAWVSTGASKGGMTSVFHRRFYPDDIDATVAYVAPISFAAPDDRYEAFFATIGDTVGAAECRQAVRDRQREALVRHVELAALAEELAGEHGYSFTRLGGLEPALELAVAELEWAYWQYLGVGFCGSIPGEGASAAELFGFVNAVGSVDQVSDQAIARFEPYFYQAETELGYPSVPTGHIADLITYDPSPDGLLPAGVTVDHDPAPMLDMARWAKQSGTGLLFIYGEYDPWTGGAFDISGNDGARSLMVAAGTHGAAIADLAAADKQAALDLLEMWTGHEVDESQAARARRQMPVSELEAVREPLPGLLRR